MIERGGRTYRSVFLEGAAGKELYIASGNVRGDQVVMTLDRNEIKGALMVTMHGPDLMYVTLSVRSTKNWSPLSA
jgi:hypothetical protein